MRGNRDLRERLEDLSREIPARAGAALVTEGGFQLRVAQERTPWLTGRLAASGMVSGASVDGHDVVVRYGFGGPSGEVPYAMAQHQGRHAHARGVRAWLSVTAREQRGKMLRRIARTLRIV